MLSSRNFRCGKIIWATNWVTAVWFCRSISASATKLASSAVIVLGDAVTYLGVTVRSNSGGSVESRELVDALEALERLRNIVGAGSSCRSDPFVELPATLHGRCNGRCSARTALASRPRLLARTALLFAVRRALGAMAFVVVVPRPIMPTSTPQQASHRAIMHY